MLQPTVKVAYDKMSVVIVTLNEKTESEDELTGMLNTLLSPEKTADSKKRELEEKYRISMDYETEKEMNIMCNLSEWVEEKGVERGRMQIIETLLRQGKLSDEDIAEAAGIDVAKLRKMKEEFSKMEK